MHLQWQTNRKPYMIYRAVPCLMTANPDFKDMPLFSTEYLKTVWRMRYTNGHYRPLIESELVESYHSQWPRVTFECQSGTMNGFSVYISKISYVYVQSQLNGRSSNVSNYICYRIWSEGLLQYWARPVSDSRVSCSVILITDKETKAGDQRHNFAGWRRGKIINSALWRFPTVSSPTLGHCIKCLLIATSNKLIAVYWPKQTSRCECVLHTSLRLLDAAAATSALSINHSHAYVA